MLIISADLGKISTDLSKTPAFTENGNTIYWDALTKEVARLLFDEGMRRLGAYKDCVGSISGAEILGCLEDNYPDWVAEFEG